MPRHERLKLKHPFCIFCGGTEPMTSVEHMPPRVLFERKQRPRGLEFPSCQKCQDSTRREELAVAMFSRIYPDSPTEKGRKEYQKIIRSVSRNHPGLLEEMNIDRLAVLRDIGEAANRLPTWNFLNCGGPLATTIISKFATKLAAALHFELTHEIVPRGAAIFVMHFTNYSAIVEGMPIDLLDALGVEKILAMGAQHSGGVFSYQSRRLNGEPTTIHMAYFRQSFALLLGVFPRFSDVPPQAVAHIVIH